MFCSSLGESAQTAPLSALPSFGLSPAHRLRVGTGGLPCSTLPARPSPGSPRAGQAPRCARCGFPGGVTSWGTSRPAPSQHLHSFLITTVPPTSCGRGRAQARGKKGLWFWGPRFDSPFGVRLPSGHCPSQNLPWLPLAHTQIHSIKHQDPFFELPSYHPAGTQLCVDDAV